MPIAGTYFDFSLTIRNSAFAALCMYVFNMIITQDCHYSKWNLKQGYIKYLVLFTKLYEVLSFPSYITAALNISWMHFLFWNAEGKLVLPKGKWRIPVGKNVLSYREGNNCFTFREHRYHIVHFMQLVHGYAFENKIDLLS